MIRVSGINRGRIRGSFLISAYAIIDGKKYHVGTDAILSRWNVEGCANCQTHLETKAFIGLDEAVQDADEYKIEVHTRDGLLDRHEALATVGRKPFQFMVR